MILKYTHLWIVKAHHRGFSYWAFKPTFSLLSISLLYIYACMYPSHHTQTLASFSVLSLSRVPLSLVFHMVSEHTYERDLGFALLLRRPLAVATPPCRRNAALPCDALPCAALPCDAALPPCCRCRRSALPTTPPCRPTDTVDLPPRRSSRRSAAALPLSCRSCCSHVWLFPSVWPPPPCLCYSASSQLLISSWPSRPPCRNQLRPACRHPLMSLSPLSTRGCPGNPESTLS